MNHRRRFVMIGLAAWLFAAGLLGGAGPQPVLAAPPLAPPIAPPAQDQPDVMPDAPLAEGMILSYSSKFVCTEALRPGQFWFGPAAPIVQQSTQVLVHNPNAFPVRLFKKAVIAPIEKFDTIPQGVAPGKWRQVTLAPDYAFHIDCDDIAKLLTGNANATFLGTYGIGVTVEGFVVIGVGQQQVPGANLTRFGVLDVVGEWSRSSEVMKKDIHFQPWWRWWWWSATLPWKLGYAYQRILPAQPGVNIDCRDALYRSLVEDAATIVDPQQESLTLEALAVGKAMDPSNPSTISADSKPALVALIGGCDKIGVGTGVMMSVDYVLVSNKASTDPDPRTGGVAQASAVKYPWVPGRWYDLALVTPQNLDVDIHDYFLRWQTQRWVAAGETAANAQAAMVHWFPYWCGWGYWNWWWNGGDCIDIGVGEGESLDVEAITPVRVFMPQWPPAQ